MLHTQAWVSQHRVTFEGALFRCYKKFHSLVLFFFCKCDQGEVSEVGWIALQADMTKAQVPSVKGIFTTVVTLKLNYAFTGK